MSPLRAHVFETCPKNWPAANAWPDPFNLSDCFADIKMPFPRLSVQAPLHHLIQRTCPSAKWQSISWDGCTGMGAKVELARDAHSVIIAALANLGAAHSLIVED